VGGLAWLDELVSQVLAVNLGGNGYPFSYTAKAAFVKPEIEGGPPHEKATWTNGRDDVVDWDRWSGRTVVETEALKGCRPGSETGELRYSTGLCSRRRRPRGYWLWSPPA